MGLVMGVPRQLANGTVLRPPSHCCGSWSSIDQGEELCVRSPAEFDAQFKADIARFAKVVEQAKIPKLD